tara:strand:- start:14881 stop:15087 length:207 start_codon:yes stop_codon:yes gene_type:complete
VLLRARKSAVKIAETPDLIMSFITEFWQFLKVRKKFWMLPIIILMVVFGGLVILAKGSAIAPFIYTIF